MRRGAPTCSVVIPVRDDAVALRRCLAAITVQQDAPDEVVVVDNASGDGSAALAERWGARVVREQRIGIAAAAAAGYDAAAGELILRLDADSRPPADWVGRIRRRFAADPALDALTGPGAFTAVPAAVRGPLTDWYWRTYFDRIGRRVGATPLFGSNLALRAEAWRAVAGAVHRADPEIHDDLDMTVHLVAAGRCIAFDPQLVVPVSARPLLHPFGLIRRARRAAHTLALHRAPDLGARGGAAGRDRSRRPT
ncbi:glycosyltransferase [Amnibacterium kyonggiense]